MRKDKVFLKGFKRLSILLVFAMVIGLFHTQATFARITSKKDYEVIRAFSDLSVVKKGNKMGIIDKDGKLIVPFLYDSLW